MQPVIDLNCDVGELPAMVDTGRDDELAACVSSVNIACGGHAGDESSMRRIVLAAAAAGTHVGAHPGYPDRAAFGRVRMVMPAHALRVSVCEQVERLRSICDSCGVALRHVKPHGALYHDCREPAIAHACGEAVRDACGLGVRMVIQAGNHVAASIWRELGFAVISEGFADRGYSCDGSLIARGRPGAMLTPEDAAHQAVSIARDRCVMVQGTPITVHAQTVCVHGDSDDALLTARAVSHALRNAGISVRGLEPS